MLTKNSNTIFIPNLKLVDRAGVPSSTKISWEKNAWMKPQSRGSKLKLLQYLVHTNECLTELVHKPASGRKPSRCLFPILLYYYPHNMESFHNILLSLSPPHPLLYLNDNPLPFNLFRILGLRDLQTIGVLKTKTPGTGTAGSCWSPYILTASSATIERTVVVQLSTRQRGGVRGYSTIFQFY